MISTSAWVGLARQVNRLYWDSSFVVSRRCRAAATGTMTTDEFQDMLTEKPSAFLSSLMSGSREIMKGGYAVEVARCAIQPIEARAGQNAHRLRMSDI